MLLCCASALPAKPKQRSAAGTDIVRRVATLIRSSSVVLPGACRPIGFLYY
jgi:hypothetical protein